MEILNKLDDDRIVRFTISPDRKLLLLEEQCDQCFESELTKEEAIQFVNELNELIKQMI